MHSLNFLKEYTVRENPLIAKRAARNHIFKGQICSFLVTFGDIMVIYKEFTKIPVENQNNKTNSYSLYIHIESHNKEQDI